MGGGGGAQGRAETPVDERSWRNDFQAGPSARKMHVGKKGRGEGRSHPEAPGPPEPGAARVPCLQQPPTGSLTAAGETPAPGLRQGFYVVFTAPCLSHL